MNFEEDIEFIKRFTVIVKNLFDSFIEKYESNPVLKDKMNNTIIKNISLENIVI